MDREELRAKSMENRTKNAERNRISVCGYVEKEIMSAVNMGRTSTILDYGRLKMIAFGNDDLLHDIVNHYRNGGLSIYHIKDSEGKKKIEIGWD